MCVCVFRSRPVIGTVSAKVCLRCGCAGRPPREARGLDGELILFSPATTFPGRGPCSLFSPFFALRSPLFFHPSHCAARAHAPMGLIPVGVCARAASFPFHGAQGASPLPSSHFVVVVSSALFLALPAGVRFVFVLVAESPLCCPPSPHVRGAPEHARTAMQCAFSHPPVSFLSTHTSLSPPLFPLSLSLSPPFSFTPAGTAPGSPPPPPLAQSPGRAPGRPRRSPHPPAARR